MTKHESVLLYLYTLKIGFLIGKDQLILLCVQTFQL